MLLGWSVSDLQNGWTTATLGELGVWGSGGTPSRSNPRYYGGDVPWTVIGDLNDQTLSSTTAFITREGLNNSSAKLVQPNTLLIAMYGSIGKLAVTAIECATNQAIAFCVPHEQATSTKYLYWALRHARPELIERGQGAGQQNISQTILKSFEIKLAPLSEQTRIVNALDNLLAQVDTLKAHLDALPTLIKRFRQSVLTAAVSGELTEEIPKKNESGNSQGTPLSVVVEDIRYGTAQKCAYGGGPTGVLRIPNIGGSGIDLSDLKSSSFSHAELEKLSLNAGDIVLIRSNGSVDLVGKSAVVTEREEGLLFAGYLIRIRLKRDIAEPAYINYWLKSPKARTSIENKARSTSGVNNINSQEILSLELMIPNLAEQRKIVRRADQLFAFADQLEARLADARQRVDALTQSILAKAFRGELVPQDPNDEPASVLLERIAAQRAADPKPKRGRKAAAHQPHQPG